MHEHIRTGMNAYQGTWGQQPMMALLYQICMYQFGFGFVGYFLSMRAYTIVQMFGGQSFLFIYLVAFIMLQNIYISIKQCSLKFYKQQNCFQH